MSSEEMRRNPSPPPLTKEEKDIIESDFIGNSLFSKKWVLSMLMKMLELSRGRSLLNNVDKECGCGSSTCSKPCSNGSENVLDAVNNCCPLPLTGNHVSEQFDKELEEDLCELWDMTMNEDVALFMIDNEADTLVADVILCTDIGRLEEICFGILGNMVCVESVCKSLSEKESFRDLVLDNLANSDAPCLVELTRLLSTCLSKKSVLPYWISAVAEKSSIDNLLFIIRSSLNASLVANAVGLVDVIFDADEELLKEYASEDLFLAIQDAYEQLRSCKQDAIAPLLHVLQLLSTVEVGAHILATSAGIAPFLCRFIRDHKRDIVITEVSESALASAFSVLSCVLSSSPDALESFFSKDVDVVAHLIKVMSLEITCLCQGNARRSVVEKVSGTEPCPVRDEEGDLKTVYFGIFLDFLTSICSKFATCKNSQPMRDVVSSRQDEVVAILAGCLALDVPEWLPNVKDMLLICEENDLLDKHYFESKPFADLLPRVT